MVIDFASNQEEIFSPLFYVLQDCKTRYVINYGGSASGKSYSQHQLELMNILDNPEHDTMIIRKYGTTLYDSCYKLLETIADNWGVKHLLRWTFSNAKRQVMNPNGRRIVFKGLDDSEKIKSIAGIKRIVVEEASELEQKDLMELMRRVRGIQGIQIILLFNPISDQHWIKKLFFDQDVFKLGVDLTIVRTTYKDNPHLFPEDLQVYELMKAIDYNQYRIYALAEWGVLNNDKPWLYAFSYKKHVSVMPLKLIPNMPVHLSFDFNINPITCIAGQHTTAYGPGSFVHILKEYKLANTTIGELCKRIRSDFPASVFTATGDATGRNRNAGYEHGDETMWTLLKRKMNLSDAQILTPLSNPSWKNSRFLCNVVLQGHHKFVIDPSCKELINDCLIAKPIDTKNPDKEDELYKETGNSTYGMHLFDAFRYYNSTHFHNFAKNPYNNA